MRSKYTEREIDEAINYTTFNSFNELIALLDQFNLKLDDAIDNKQASNYILKIVKAYVENCSNPHTNIAPLTMILGEEDLNPDLLIAIQETIEAREKKDDIHLPNLHGIIKEASKNVQSANISKAGRNTMFGESFADSGAKTSKSNEKKEGAETKPKSTP